MPPAVLPTVATATASAVCSGWSVQIGEQRGLGGQREQCRGAKLAANRAEQGLHAKFSAAIEKRLSRADPEVARLRRGDRVAARARRRHFPSASATALLLKREDLQPVFSFKLRGAYNKMARPAAKRACAAA